LRGCLALILLLGGILTTVALGGCGGKLASSGWATIANIDPHGRILLRYDNGKTAWKRLDQDNFLKDFRMVQKNLFKPAKFVETKKGSTLTFPGGDTLVYRDVDFD
jgi:hypothetical protein